MADTTARCTDGNWRGPATVVAGPDETVPLAGVTGVSAGNTHFCLALLTGEARCWGTNTSGQLGDGTTVTRALPARVIAPLP